MPAVARNLPGQVPLCCVWFGDNLVSYVFGMYVQIENQLVEATADEIIQAARTEVISPSTLVAETLEGPWQLASTFPVLNQIFDAAAIIDAAATGAFDC